MSSSNSVLKTTIRSCALETRCLHVRSPTRHLTMSTDIVTPLAELTEVLVFRIFDDEMYHLDGLEGQFLDYVHLGKHVFDLVRLVDEHVGLVQKFHEVADAIIEIHLLDDGLCNSIRDEPRAE